jgi:large subunit ribosomal protein L6
MSLSTSASRVARKPITLPQGVDVKVNGQELAVKGPKGTMKLSLLPFTQIVIEGNQVKIMVDEGPANYCRSGSGTKLRKSIPGTVRAQISNAVQGVTKGFERKLMLVGVGYRAQVKGKVLGLTLGFSHPVDFPIPEGITIETPSQTEVILKGMDKHLIGHTASMIRELRGPEPYKGKGIRYAGELIILKETKKK